MEDPVDPIYKRPEIKAIPEKFMIASGRKDRESFWWDAHISKYDDGSEMLFVSSRHVGVHGVSFPVCCDSTAPLSRHNSIRYNMGHAYMQDCPCRDIDGFLRAMVAIANARWKGTTER